MTGLGAQMGKFKHGIGTSKPFRFLTYGNKTPTDLKKELDQIGIGGLEFKLMSLVNSSGKKVEGVYIVLKDWNDWDPTELAFHMMKLSAKWESPSPFTQAKESEITLFNKHVGSTLWWDHLADEGPNCDVQGFLSSWDKQVEIFRDRTQKYYLY